MCSSFKKVLFIVGAGTIQREYNVLVKHLCTYFLCVFVCVHMQYINQWHATEKQQLKTKQSKTKINKHIKTQTNSPEYESDKIKTTKSEILQTWGGGGGRQNVFVQHARNS